MATFVFGPLVTVEEYLVSSYMPDREYVDGRLLERKLGEYDHSTTQPILLAWLINHDGEWGTRSRVEQRVQVSETRYRVPDICMLRRDRAIEQIISHPPLVCIEVLSPDDSYGSMR